MEKYQVYITRNELNNKYYIGMHKGDIFEDNYYGSGVHLKRAIKKYGKENFDRQVVSDNLTKLQARWLERALVGESAVNDLNSYNLAYGGNYNEIRIGRNLSEEHKMRIANALRGRKLSSEHKQKLSKIKKGVPLNESHKKKISKAHKGRVSPMKNKTHTENSKNKMSKSQTGIFHTDETRDKIGSTLQKYYKENGHNRTGIKLNEEHKIKISNSLPKTIIHQYTIDGKFIKEWPSVKSATKSMGLKSTSSISNVLIGRSNTAAGFKWKYKKS